jgi:UDP-glucose:(heptosyl)LPS alpha-1,3-glucosyltransferase
MRIFSHRARTLVRREDFDVTLSLDRTEYQDIWRAGEGVHRTWLERRKLFEPGTRVWFTSRAPRQRVLLRLEQRCVEQTPHIIANSKMVCEDLVSTYGIQPDRITVIPNGVDLDIFSPKHRQENRDACRAELGIAADRPVLLFVGSGFHRKGLREALQALSALPDALLLIIGRDKPPPWRKHAARLGVEKQTRFLGPRPALVPLYHAADATIFPSWFDSFGFVGLESLACGTPLVTTSYAGVAETIRQGENGRVIKRPDDTGAMAAALKELLERDGTQEHAEHIAASVSGYSLERNVEQSLSLIESIGSTQR